MAEKKRKVLKRSRRSQRSEVMRLLGRLLSWAFLIVFILTSVVVLVTPNKVKQFKETEKVLLKEKATPKEIGLFYVRDGNYLEAEKYLYQAFKANPVDLETLRYLIMAAKYSADFKLLTAILPKYVKAIEDRISEVEREIYSLREELYASQDDSKLKEELSLREGQLASYYSSWIEMKVLYAKTLAITGELQKALKIAAELKQRFPKNKKLRDLDELLAVMAGDPQAIIDIINSKPKEEWRKREYSLVAASYLALKRYSKARELYREAIKRYPSEDEFIIGLIQSYRQEGRYEDVLRVLKDKVGYTEKPEMLFYYGEALWKLGKHDEAEKYFKEAISKTENKLMKKHLEKLISKVKAGEKEKVKERGEGDATGHGSDRNGLKGGGGASER